MVESGSKINCLKLTTSSPVKIGQTRPSKIVFYFSTIMAFRGKPAGNVHSGTVNIDTWHTKMMVWKMPHPFKHSCFRYQFVKNFWGSFSPKGNPKGLLERFKKPASNSPPDFWWFFVWWMMRKTCHLIIHSEIIPSRMQIYGQHPITKISSDFKKGCIPNFFSKHPIFRRRSRLELCNRYEKMVNNNEGPLVETKQARMHHHECEALQMYLFFWGPPYRFYIVFFFSHAIAVMLKNP